MDYTLSNGYVTDGGTGNRMHLQAQAIPTVVSDLDMNSLIWNVMEVVKAAGLSGAQFDRTIPATYQKLLTALRSAGVFATPAQFDATTKPATTAFVQRALGNRQAAAVLSATVALTAAAAGTVYHLSSVSPFTVTLPAPTAGLSFTFNNTNAGVVTLATASGGFSTGILNPPTLPLASGDCVELVAINSSWFAIGGSAALRGNGGDFGSSLTVSSYQKLPSGLILQWGGAATSASVSTFVTFPLTFPNACFRVLAVNSTVGVSNATATAYSKTTSGFSVDAYTPASARAAVPIEYFSIGF